MHMCMNILYTKCTINSDTLIERFCFVFFGGGEYPEKTTDLSQVADKLYHIMLCQVHHAWAGFELMGGGPTFILRQFFMCYS
jgi:hypothetical protein